MKVPETVGGFKKKLGNYNHTKAPFRLGAYTVSYIIHEPQFQSTVPEILETENKHRHRA